MARRRWVLPALGVGVGAFLYGLVRLGQLRRLTASGERFAETSAGGYDAWATKFMCGLYDRIAREAAAALPVGEVLDVGCGPGNVALRIAQLAPSVAVTGVDISPGMIEVASLHAADLGLATRTSFQVGDVKALPFEDERFDLVVSSFSLHHWADPAGGLAEVYRVLKPGGQARIYDLPDWVRRYVHGQDDTRRLVQLASASPFGSGVVAVVRWPLWFPSVRCLYLRREK